VTSKRRFSKRTYRFAPDLRIELFGYADAPGLEAMRIYFGRDDGSERVRFLGDLADGRRLMALAKAILLGVQRRTS